MQKRDRTSRLRGFSLIELMAAVAIVAILVSLALPRFRLFIARSRMAEAKTNLGIIATLQQSYLVEYQKYIALTKVDKSNCASDKNELGFRVVNCELLYGYESTGGGATSFTANADSGTEVIYPGCSGKNDKWEINEKRKLEHKDSVIKKCHD